MNFSKQNPNHVTTKSNMSKPQRHSEKFQKSSILFMQLGLVLALFIVYLAFEFTTVKKITVIDDSFVPEIATFIPDEFPDIIIERTTKPKPVVEKSTTLKHPVIVPNKTRIKKTVLVHISDLDPTINLGVLPDDSELEDVIEEGEPIDFKVLEEAPIFPGCEGLDSSTARKCFENKIRKFVNKRFNTGLAEELNLTHGKQRIAAHFTIDKNGYITDLNVVTPHKRLEKEAIRVVLKLPKMTPGKQRMKPVPVKYMLPITFLVQ